MLSLAAHKLLIGPISCISCKKKKKNWGARYFAKKCYNNSMAKNENHYLQINYMTALLEYLDLVKKPIGGTALE